MKDLDMNLVIKNIRYLIKISDSKMGELEKEISVSPGYFARLEGKENAVKPNAEILYKIGQYFGISLDLLLNSDISTFNDDITYLTSLLDKILLLTQTSKIRWEYEDDNKIQNGSPFTNPLYSYEPIGFNGDVDIYYRSKFTGEIIQEVSLISTKIKEKLYFIVKYPDLNMYDYEFYLVENGVVSKIFLSKYSGCLTIFKKFEELFDFAVKTSQFAYLDNSMKNKLNDILDF